MGSLVNNNQIIRIDSNLLLDPTMCDAYMDGAYLCLTPNEFNILFCMAQKPGHAFSRQSCLLRHLATMILSRIECSIAISRTFARN